MGRRSVAVPDVRRIDRMTPQQARETVVAHYRALTVGAGINLAQFKAQLYEERAVELIGGFMDDVTLPAPFRRDCAKDILLYARGAVKAWEHEGNTINPDAIGRTGNTVKEEIEAARATAQAYEQINILCMKRIPVDAWPPDLQAFADPSMVAAFPVIDG
jgi:hypothetical protein